MITLLAHASIVAGVSKRASWDVTWISDLGKKAFLLGMQVLCCRSGITDKLSILGWMCFVNPGDAHNPGKRGKKLPAFRVFEGTVTFYM